MRGILDWAFPFFLEVYVAAIRLLLVIVFVVFFSACSSGGGGSESSTSISLNKRTLTFRASEGAEPAAQTIVARFRGDGIVVGYPVGVAEVSWLYIEISGNTDTTADVLIHAYGITEAGTYTTTLRFVTGKEDGSEIQYVDLPVTYTVSEGAEATVVSELIFNAVGTAPGAVLPSEGFEISLSGPNAQWSLSSDAEWLHIDQTSATGDATVTVTASPIGGLNGTVTGMVTAYDTTSNVTYQFTATMNGAQVQAVVDTDLQLVSILPDSPTTPISLTLQISDELNGTSVADAYDWQLSIPDGTEWITLSAQTGSTLAGQAQAEATLDPSALIAMGAGAYQSRIDVTLTNAYDTVVTTEIPVRVFVGSTGTEVLDSIANQLEFNITDLAADEQNQKLYVTDKDAKRLYVVDIASGLTERYFEFTAMPERVAFSEEQSRLYIALLDQEHQAVSEGPATGAIVALNTSTQVIDHGFTINLDPYDLVINDEQKLVVSSGSDQWTSIHLYDASSGHLLGEAPIRQQSRLTLHPNQSWVFSATTDSSPGDIELFTISGNNLTRDGDSPYHGEYAMGGRVWATPNSNHLITAGGDIFLAPSMIYTDSIGESALWVHDVDFDDESGIVYTVNGNGDVNRYAESSYTPIVPLLQTENTAVRVFVVGGIPYAVTVSNDVHYLEALQ